MSWRIKEFRPSSVLCNYNIGDLFWHENGHQYKLLYRDSVKAIVKRWTIVDEMWMYAKLKFRRERGRSNITN